MAYFEITDFKAGVDVRRSRYTSVPGTLQKLVNAHITRGGDVERRKEFVLKGHFGGATFGLAADDGGLVTFGSVADPGLLPEGVTYQRLVAPGGADLVSVDATEQFGGKLYVAATFADGVQWHFYDGNVVGDWSGGIARDFMLDNAGVAQHLADLINAGGIYTATRSGATLTISGPDGVDFEVVGTTENGPDGPDDQELVISGVQSPVTAVEERPAVAAVTVIAGREGAGNAISRITVNPDGVTVELLGAPVPFGVNARTTAVAVAAAINAGVATHGYRARAEYSAIMVTAPPGSGASRNGYVIQAEVTGEVCLADGRFSITDGAEDGTAKVIMVRVNGKQVMQQVVVWDVSNSATAAEIADNINNYASNPKMVAVAIGETVHVAPKVVTSTDPSSMSIVVSTEGDLFIGDGDDPPEGPPGGGGGGYDPRAPVFDEFLP